MSACARRRCRLRFAAGLFATLGIAAMSTGVACFDFGGYSLQGFEGASAGSGSDADVEDANGPCSPPVDNGKCGTYPQCGCFPLFTCDVTESSGHTECVMDQGLKRGDKCGALFSGCGFGLTCVDQTCKAFCSRKCANGGGCTQVILPGDAGSNIVPGMRVCSDQCSYQTPGAVCPAGLTCVPVLPPGVSPGYSACKPSGGSTSGCASTAECAPGLGCGEDSKCHAWCNSNYSLDCPPKQKCRSLQDGSSSGFYYVGDESFGLCMAQ